MTLLLFVLVIPSHDGMKLKFKCSPFPVDREAGACEVSEWCVEVQVILLKADYSNMYDNSTKQSLLLIGYFSGNAIELYRFGLNPSAGFFVSYFLISIIEKMHLFQSWLSVCPGRLAFVSICFSTIQADKCQLRRNRSSNCETTLTVTCCGEWSTAENDQVTIRV
ncbi:hypothetical protein T4B_7898 [Trichinella pseudospiralis]|uniref:Uncharacterized protein n=2 Tax=Trichinella pseudospiralis TaxID=6337 RepID=A0A0V1JLR1_TRIPS|nr:hypothetical protein T4D_12483 [Trichinella pseudospiralis]KRZ20500.1 hypothetical protein T4B_7898 [Trichinella pseudospiralis]KRZ35902.1 hypothetical protein T4C_4757 [Trichinella pseudospiralis]